MVGLKSIQTRVVGIITLLFQFGLITDEVHTYVSFSSNRVSMKNV